MFRTRENYFVGEFRVFVRGWAEQIRAQRIKKFLRLAELEKLLYQQNLNLLDPKITSDKKKKNNLLEQ